MVKSLRFGELAVNSNSPIFCVVKLWSRNFMYAECFYKFAACFREYLLFLRWFNSLFICLFTLAIRFWEWMWGCGVVVITTAQDHSTKPELRFCAGSYPARGVSEIRDGEDLWQWSRLEIRLNAFRRSTIPQKQFIIIISLPKTTFLLNNRVLFKSTFGYDKWKKWWKVAQFFT